MEIAAIVIMGLAMLFSTISSGIGISQTKKENEKNRQHEKELNEQSMNFSAKQAEIANQRSIENYLNFQSPQAQMNQIKEAGLSPSYMYNGSSSSGSLSSGAQASTPGLHGNFTDAVGVGNQIASMGANTNQAANTALQFNEAIKSAKNSKLIEAQTITEKYNAQSKEALARIDQANADNVATVIETELNKMNAETKLLQEQWKREHLSNNETEQLTELRVETQKEMMKAAVQSAWKKLDLDDKQIEYYDARIKEMTDNAEFKRKELAEKKRQFNEQLDQQDRLSRKERKLKEKLHNNQLEQEWKKFVESQKSQQKQWEEEQKQRKTEFWATHVHKIIDDNRKAAAQFLEAIIPL